ncbi:MAG: hypothetical protein HY701_05605 [Gemmatimonadetes bacterium]|nr:hypothetical protein [Gemmatimonadota bacterium]
MRDTGSTSALLSLPPESRSGVAVRTPVEVRPSRERARPRVLFIREWEQQMSSSGCCGRLEGDLLLCGENGERVFAERRRVMEALGPLYRAVQERYGDAVEREIVDPRNLLALAGRLLSDFLRYRVGLRAAVRTLAGLSATCVIINGRLFARGEWPTPHRLIAHLDQIALVSARLVGR